MAGRFVSPFVLDDAENGGPYLSTTDDVSLYDAVDNGMKCKVARHRAFLDDSLEEEDGPNFFSTCLTSCAIGSNEENPAVTRVVAETNSVDGLENVESDVNAKPKCSATKNDCSVLNHQPKDLPPSEPMKATSFASEPQPPAAAGVDDVDKSSPVGHKEEPATAQPSAKVMPTFGKKVTSTVGTKVEDPAKAKKPVPKGKCAKKQHTTTTTADSKKSVETEAIDSAKNCTEMQNCSLSNSQSLEDACPNPTLLQGREVTAIGEDNSEDDAGKTHGCAQKNESAREGLIKKKQSGKEEQKQRNKPKMGKQVANKEKMGKQVANKENMGKQVANKPKMGKQVANKEKLPSAEKKLELERKKVERERKKAEWEEEKIEKELRMIEREFNRLEKESRVRKQDVAAVSHMEDNVSERNEFQILNMEEESQVLDCAQPSKAGVLCVVDGDPPLPTQEGSPNRALPDEAAIPGEGAHLISSVPRGEEDEQEEPDSPGHAAVPVEESHIDPSEQVGTKKNVPSRASHPGVKLSLNLARKTAQRGAEGVAIKGMLKKAPSRGSKESAGGVREQLLQSKDEQAIGGSTAAGGGASSIEGGGASGGLTAAGGGASGGPSTGGGGASGGSTAAGGGASGGSTAAVVGTSKDPSTAGGGAEKDQKGEKTAKKLSGALKKGVSKSATGANKSTTLKCSTICATSAKLSKEKEQVDVKQMKKFIGKTRKRKCDPSNAPPARKKLANTQNHSGPVWVQCDDCKKWRALKDCHDPCQVPQKWVCSMNKDAKINSCASPEEDADELRDSQEFIYSPFVAGSVVWAKMCGYPWWPAMIDEDPDEETCYEFVGDDTHPAEYHVVFFGKPVSRAWLRTDGVRPFTGDCNMNDGDSVPLKYRQGLKGAIQEALGALDMAIDDRFAKFCFAKRYCPGNKRNRKQFTGEKLQAAPKKPKAAPKKPTKPALSKELEVMPELSEATSDDSEATPKQREEQGSEEQGIDPSEGEED